jgi:hypothetical protein
VTVAVLPALGPVVTWGTHYEDILTVQVDNLDATQNFSGTIQRRLTDAMEWAASSITDFANVLPGASVVADLDVRGTNALRLVGSMDGAGGDVRVAVVRRSSWIGSRREW